VSALEQKFGFDIKPMPSMPKQEIVSPYLKENMTANRIRYIESKEIDLHKRNFLQNEDMLHLNHKKSRHRLRV